MKKMQKKSKLNLIKMSIGALTIKVMCSVSLLVPWNSLIDNLIIIMAIFVLMLKMFKTKMKLGRFLVISFVGLLTIYTCVRIKQYDLLISLIAIYLLMNEDIEVYIALIYRIQMPMIAVHVLLSAFLSLVGFSDQFWIFTGDRLRFNGGFLHPNVLATYISSCMLMYIWKYFGKITRNRFAGLAFVIVFSYAISRSRTNFLINALLLLLAILGQERKKFLDKVLNKTLKFAFPVLSIVVYYLQTHYLTWNRWILLIDRILTGRIRYAAYAFQRSGITLFPRFLDYAQSGIVEWTPVWNLNTFTFDNVYSFLWMQVGVIWIVVVSVVIWIFVKRIDYKCKLFVLIWIVFAMTEVHGFNCFKFFPIMLLSLLFKERISK